ncbi:MAG: hypothetical protein JO199_03925 [Candidatus Eremiobacteraeota bacterium]|nr:hypothetical protein [Candidatus Eremiobacteraeota bacterium]
MAIRTKLTVVDEPRADASVLKPEVLPLLRGTEWENLHCGGCDAVIGESVSALTAKAKLAAPSQLVIVCPACGANNVLSPS